MTTHRCPAGNCKVECPWGQLMCKTHWYMLPEDMRVRVWRHWRNGSPTLNYWSLRESAIAFVNAKLSQAWMENFTRAR